MVFYINLNYNSKIKKNLDGFMEKAQKRNNWYKNLKKKPKPSKQKYFCPVMKDFYMAQSNLKNCKLCSEPHHNILYDKKIHDKIIEEEFNL